ncbi:unnamed protein product [Trifolium pratense]|uniref:Uncharacterized protein n=1 Tax=Trifolium pratense TaxID=57577 RepID=A0ACB0L9Q2_TRIPR|nr:unnamed protein product [Trifolium pratense]
MSQLKNMSILLLIAFAATILQNIEATDHIVGGSTGWTATPPGGASFYSDWASNITFKQNDVLVFNFVTGAHTVAEISKANFDNCNAINNGQKLSVKVSASSPAPAQGPSPPSPTPPSPTPPSSGTTPPSPTPPSPTPPSRTTPTPPSPTPPVNGDSPSPSSPTQPGAIPPSPGSATSLDATFSIFTVVVVNLLF